MNTLTELLEKNKAHLDGAKQFKDDFEQLLKNSEKASTKDDFYKVVNDSVTFSNRWRSYLNENLVFLKQLSQEDIDELKQNPSFGFIIQLLQSDEIINNTITQTRSRISLTIEKEVLNLEQQEKLDDFIAQLKKLDEFSEAIIQEANQFSEKLQMSKTEKEINEIEDNIDERSNQLNKKLQSSLAYPDDEETAGALLNFFNHNPNYMAKLKLFNLSEVLADNILAAKARNFQSNR